MEQNNLCKFIFEILKERLKMIYGILPNTPEYYENYRFLESYYFPENFEDTSNMSASSYLLSTEQEQIVSDSDFSDFVIASSSSSPQINMPAPLSPTEEKPLADCKSYDKLCGNSECLKTVSRNSRALYCSEYCRNHVNNYKKRDGVTGKNKKRADIRKEFDSAIRNGVTGRALEDLHQRLEGKEVMQNAEIYKNPVRKTKKKVEKF